MNVIVQPTGVTPADVLVSAFTASSTGVRLRIVLVAATSYAASATITFGQSITPVMLSTVSPARRVLFAPM